MFATATEIFHHASAVIERVPIAVLVAILVFLALILVTRLLGFWYTGVHIEYAGPGRVRFLSLFRGAGYCVVLLRGRGRDGKPPDAPGWRPNIVIPGFTIFVRTAKSRQPPHPSRGEPVRRFRITTDSNRPVV